MPPDDDELTRRVARVAERVSGRQVAGPDTPLELDSIGQAELALALEDELGVRVPEGLPLRTPHEATLAVSGVLANGAHPVTTTALAPGIGHLQWLATAVMSPVLRRYYRLRVTGSGHVPRTGPVILAPNHDSLLDIPFLAMACPRRVWFMAKRELYRKRTSAWMFHVLGGFPVSRGEFDLGAIRAALEALERGMAVTVYPEGTRSRDFLPFLPGAAWLSLFTGAPLVPVAIRGTGDSMPSGSVVPRRTDVAVSFGEPMTPGREDDPQARLGQAPKLTEALRAEVERLLRS